MQNEPTDASAPLGYSRMFNNVQECSAHQVLEKTNPFPRAGSEQAEQEVRERRGEQRAVDDVQHAAEAGDGLAGVLHLGVALDEAFEQVAELSDAADHDAEDQTLPPREVIRDQRRAN